MDSLVAYSDSDSEDPYADSDDDIENPTVEQIQQRNKRQKAKKKWENELRTHLPRARHGLIVNAQGLRRSARDRTKSSNWMENHIKWLFFYIIVSD